MICEPTDDQLALAHQIGGGRRSASSDGRCNRPDGTIGNYRTDFLAALAEIFVAQNFCGVIDFVPTVNDFTGPDITVDDLAIHVRHSPKHSNNLIVRDRDRKKTLDDKYHIFCLVTGDEHEMHIRGFWPLEWTKLEALRPYCEDPDGRVWIIYQSALVNDDDQV